MIDDPHKTAALVATMTQHLPIGVTLTDRLRQTLAAQTPGMGVPHRGSIVKVMYAGDEGGILCGLDLGETESPTVAYVSLTHLSVGRRAPLFREIEAYQRHRIKKLKRQVGRGF